MCEKVSRAKKLDALILEAKGHNLADITMSLSTSQSTIKRAKTKQKKYGDIEGGQGKRGRKLAVSSGRRGCIIPYYLFKEIDIL